MSDSASATSTPADLATKVKRRLSETGYPLELRVAREARRHTNPVYVTQSRQYVDPLTDKLRETDVVACWTAQSGDDFRFVYLSIECKSKPLPWVIFDAGEGPTDDAKSRWEWAVRHEFPDPWSNAADLSDYFHLNRTLFRPSLVGTGVVEVDMGSSTPRDQRNAAWDAVQSAVAAAHGITRDMNPEDPLPGTEWASIRIAVFPVVVTSGALFRGFLTPEGELAVEPIERGEVLVRSSTDVGLTRCLIVTEDALPEVLAHAAETVKAM